MVFAPLVGTALASALLLLASPLLLPPGQRYSADAVIGGVLLAGTVAGFAWLACNRLLLEAVPPSPLTLTLALTLALTLTLTRCGAAPEEVIGRNCRFLQSPEFLQGANPNPLTLTPTLTLTPYP